MFCRFYRFVVIRSCPPLPFVLLKKSWMTIRASWPARWGVRLRMWCNFLFRWSDNFEARRLRVVSTSAVILYDSAGILETRSYTRFSYSLVKNEEAKSAVGKYTVTSDRKVWKSSKWPIYWRVCTAAFEYAGTATTTTRQASWIIKFFFSSAEKCAFGAW